MIDCQFLGMKAYVNRSKSDFTKTMANMSEDTLVACQAKPLSVSDELAPSLASGWVCDQRIAHTR